MHFCMAFLGKAPVTLARTWHSDHLTTHLVWRIRSLLKMFACQIASGLKPKKWRTVLILKTPKHLLFQNNLLNTIKKSIFSPLQKTREKCHRCSRPIMESSLRALERIYHPECFRCSMCPKTLEGTQFFVTNDTKEPVCKEDFERLVFCLILLAFLKA